MRKLAIFLISISLLSCEQLSINDNNNLESIYPMTKKVNTSDLYFSKEIQDPYRSVSYTHLTLPTTPYV